MKEQKKTVGNVNVGDRVRVRYEGQALAEAHIGQVAINNERQCVIEKENGLTVTVFGSQDGDAGRHWPGLIVEKIR